ncbi:hypothetical protein C8R44DRAFT_16411 [Mycena epipterygia]|nr:hypothetical protein C8R44DRAFT_16411 [Mycena epipterygia]
MAESSRRLETLDIFSETGLPGGAWFQMRNNIPLLREIHICAVSVKGFSVGDIFEIAPSLQTVRITEPRIHKTKISSAEQTLLDRMPRPPANTFPWSQLTHYESQHSEPSLFDALSLAQNLVVCHATIVVDRHHVWNPPTQFVRLPRLQKLALRAPDLLLDRLDLPSLQDFFIETSPGEFHRVVALVQRSECTLRRFWIESHQGGPPPAQYRQILQSNPDIAELGIIGPGSAWPDHYENMDNIFRGLRAGVDATDVVVPDLRAFHIHLETGLNISIVIDMLESRLAGAQCATLKQFGIRDNGSRTVWQELKPCIPRLEQQGLEVKIRSRRSFGTYPSDAYGRSKHPRRFEDY